MFSVVCVCLHVHKDWVSVQVSSSLPVQGPALDPHTRSNMFNLDLGHCNWNHYIKSRGNSQYWYCLSVCDYKFSIRIGSRNLSWGRRSVLTFQKVGIKKWAQTNFNDCRKAEFKSHPSLQTFDCLWRTWMQFRQHKIKPVGEMLGCMYRCKMQISPLPRPPLTIAPLPYMGMHFWDFCFNWKNYRKFMECMPI